MKWLSSKNKHVSEKIKSLAEQDLIEKDLYVELVAFGEKIKIIDSRSNEGIYLEYPCGDTVVFKQTDNVMKFNFKTKDSPVFYGEVSDLISVDFDNENIDFSSHKDWERYLLVLKRLDWENQAPHTYLDGEFKALKFLKDLGIDFNTTYRNKNHTFCIASDKICISVDIYRLAVYEKRRNEEFDCVTAVRIFRAPVLLDQMDKFYEKLWETIDFYSKTEKFEKVESEQTAWFSEFVAKRFIEQKEFDDTLKKYMEFIFESHAEYNRLAIKFGALPIAKIVDYKTYEAFCKLTKVDLDNRYKNYSRHIIENYLRAKEA